PPLWAADFSPALTLERMSGSFAPVLLLFALHGRCIRVLHFKPIRRAAGTVSGILALRDNAFKAELASVSEDGRAVAFHVFVELYPGAGLGHDSGERGLATLERIAPQIVAVQFDQVEGVQERAVIMAAAANEIERGNAVVTAGNRLAINDAGARAQ